MNTLQKYSNQSQNNFISHKIISLQQTEGVLIRNNISSRSISIFETTIELTDQNQITYTFEIGDTILITPNGIIKNKG